MSKVTEQIKTHYTETELEYALDTARKALNFIIANEPPNYVGSSARDAAKALMVVINEHKGVYDEPPVSMHEFLARARASSVGGI